MSSKNTSAEARKRKKSLLGAVVEVWRFRVFTIILLAIPTNLLKNALSLVVNSSGSAITTANVSRFLNWRTPLLAVLTVLLILLYLVCQILAQSIYVRMPCWAKTPTSSRS